MENGVDLGTIQPEKLPSQMGPPYPSLREIWGSLGLNQGPTGYESAALTAELLPLRMAMIVDKEGQIKTEIGPSW